MAAIYFTPGPSALYPTVSQHLQTALELQIGSISHRSGDYKAFHQQAVENLRELLGVPSSHGICFFASATEIWERLLQNCISTSSFHFTNGVFSHRFYEIAQLLQKPCMKKEAIAGTGFTFEANEIPEEVEMLHFTHNESSTGVMQPLETIYQYAAAFPNALLSLDIVSSAPFPVIDYEKIHAVYFSVQKGMGLPAGLGVLIAHPKILAKAEALEKSGTSIGSYHRFTDVWKKAAVFQTPETPNILNIFLLSKVTQDMLQKGVDIIRKETLEKVALLAEVVAETEHFNWLVKDET
ncbi:MAG: aminotransferase class V-fold PLP-dependent enzyme, partial [Bacteroidia bacterium]